MERLDWRNYSSLTKSLGTIVSIVGAFVVTLCKGPPLLTKLSPANSSRQQLLSQESKFILGGLFLAADCVMASVYIVVQAKIIKKYPAELIIVFFYCFYVAILSGLTCLFLERDASAWSLQPKLRLLAVLYSMLQGVFGSAFQVGVTTWCLHQTGPVFISMFKPLGIVISVVAGVIFLGDSFYLGRGSLCVRREGAFLQSHYSHKRGREFVCTREARFLVTRVGPSGFLPSDWPFPGGLMSERWRVIRA